MADLAEFSPVGGANQDHYRRMEVYGCSADPGISLMMLPVEPPLAAVGFHSTNSACRDDDAKKLADATC